MASNGNTTAQTQAIEDLQNRMEWLDNERRKFTRRLTEMEQRLEQQERELNTREQRIQSLERQLASTNAQLTRIPQVDAQLAQFKDDIVKMIEQYDQRRLQSEAELDRLRRVESEGTVRELAALRKEISRISHLETSMEQRKAEESRLANLIGKQQNRLSNVDNRVENWENALTFIEEKEKQNGRHISEVQASLVEFSKKDEHLQTRIDSMAGAIPRLETKLQTIANEQGKIETSNKSWMEQLQIGEYERNQKLERWRELIESQQDTLDRFSREWITYSDQYKEAKMAIQTLSQWQEQVEKQQREQTEMLRVETHRMRARWDDFLLENQKLRKNFEIESEQRWSSANRHEREIREHIDRLEALIESLDKEKDTLARVQTAQADAIKQFPRIWLEMVENAIQQDPNRRRQPALVPVREE